LVVGVPAAWYGTHRPAPAPKASAAPQAPRTPAPRPRSLELYFTGDIRLTSLTYTVNGRSTTLKKVTLPWRTVIAVPALPDLSTWRIAYRFPPGSVTWRVLVDGFESAGGGSSSTGRPSGDHANGSN
jgi:hypothetical protein